MTLTTLTEKKERTPNIKQDAEFLQVANAFF